MLTIDTEFFTPPKAAKLLGVSHNQIIYYIHAGELRAVDLSKHRGGRPRWRISRTDLEALLSSRSTDRSGH